MRQRILLVGGTSEVGLAIVQALAREAESLVCLAGRDHGRLGECAALLMQQGVPTTRVAYDAEWDERATRRMVAQADEDLGGFDVVVIAVGALSTGSPAHSGCTNDHDLQEVLMAYLVGPALVLDAALTLMTARGHGSVVVVPPAVASTEVVGLRSPVLAYSMANRGLQAVASHWGERVKATGATCLVVQPDRVRARSSQGIERALSWVDPEDVATRVVRDLRRNRARTLTE